MLTEDEYYCYTITWLMLLFNSFVTIYSNKYFLLFPSPNAAPRPFGSQFAVVMWLECLETFVRLVGFWVFWGILTLFCLLRPLPLQLSQVWVRVWDFISNILVCVQSSKEKFSKLPPNLDEMTGKREAPGRSFGWLNIDIDCEKLGTASAVKNIQAHQFVRSWCYLPPLSLSSCLVLVFMSFSCFLFYFEH